MNMNRQEVLELYLAAADKPKKDFLKALQELEKLIQEDQWDKELIIRFCWGKKKKDKKVLAEHSLIDENLKPETIEFAVQRAERLVYAITAGVTKPLSFVLFAEEIQRRTEEATERWYMPFKDIVAIWVKAEACEI